MSKTNRIFKLIPLLILLFSIIILSSGCATKSVVGDAYKNTIATPEQAGIKTYDSTGCETCHADPKIIASFEKPGEHVVEAGGG